VDTILEMAEYRKIGRARKLIVAGCLVERYRGDIRRDIPEVDALIGTNELDLIAGLCEGWPHGCGDDGGPDPAPAYLYHDLTPRVLATPGHYAYIKIAEGCDHPCTFCVIPQYRGKFRSRRLESVIAEATRLFRQGVREINLIGFYRALSPPPDGFLVSSDALDASLRSVKYPFARSCLSLGSRSVPMYSSRKSSRTWTLGVRRDGPEKSAHRVIGSGAHWGRTGIKPLRTSGRFAIHRGRTEIPNPLMASFRPTAGSPETTRKRMFGVAIFLPRLSFQVPEPMQLWAVRSSGVAGLPDDWI
jgi:hypothetical protein